MTLNGFAYEPPDPSVGWFAGYWIHEACPLPESDVEQVPMHEHHEGNGMNRRRVITYRLTCRTCHATAVVQDEDHDPTPEAVAEMMAELKGE